MGVTPRIISKKSTKLKARANSYQEKVKKLLEKAEELEKAGK